MPWSISDERLADWTEIAQTRLTTLRRAASRPGVRVAVLGVVLPLFGIALFLAWNRAGIAIDNLSFGPILVVVAGVLAGVATAIWQLRAMARTGGVEIPRWSALRIVTLGTLSSLLPVSSGTVIRGGAIVVWGVPAGKAGTIVLYDAILWTCLSLLYSGVAAFAEGAPLPGVAMTVAGLVLAPLTVFLARSLPVYAGAGELVMARGTGLAVQVVRLQACFLALGHAVTFLQVSTLAAASPVASLFFFLPGGLGVREAFTSALAAAVGLGAAGAFLAAALNRLVGLTVLLMCEGAFFILPFGPTERGDS